MLSKVMAASPKEYAQYHRYQDNDIKYHQQSEPLMSESTITALAEEQDSKFSHSSAGQSTEPPNKAHSKN